MNLYFFKGANAIRAQLKVESAKYMNELENGADTVRLLVIKQRMLALQAQLERTINHAH